MKIDKRESLSGLLILCFGSLVIFESLNYTVGSLLRMGPGYFPLVLGISLSAIGIVLLVRSIFVSSIIDSVQWRPLVFVTLGLVVFGLGINSLGVFFSTTALVFISRFSQKDLCFLNTTVLALSLNIIVYLVFIYGLSIPLKLFPWS